jgi:hypothetical protein
MFIFKKLLLGKDFADALLSAFIYRWNCKRSVTQFAASIAASSKSYESSSSTTATAAIVPTSSKSLAAVLVAQSIMSIDYMTSLAEVNSTFSICVSNTSGFTYVNPEIRGKANPEYVTLKSKTSSQQGAHSSTKPHQGKRVVTNHIDIDTEQYSKRQRLRAGEITESDSKVLFGLVDTFADEIICWDDICSLFNEKTGRTSKEGKSLTTLQVKNAYRNKKRMCFSSCAASDIDTSVAMLSSSSPSLPISSFSGISLSAQPSFEAAKHNAVCRNSKFSYEQIASVSIEEATKGQEWSPQEIELLKRFRPCGDLNSEIVQDGVNKFISFRKLRSRYCYYIRLMKLNDPTANVYIRTEDAIKNKVKYLRELKSF